MNVSGANNSLSDVDNSPSGADDILSRCAGAKLTTEESARILSEILPIFFHERMQPLDPRHVSEQACARLLAEHAELQTLLEEAVEAQSCRVLWECDLLSFKNVRLRSYDCVFSERFLDDAAALLDEHREKIADFANGRSDLPRWTPPGSTASGDATGSGDATAVGDNNAIGEATSSGDGDDQSKFLTSLHLYQSGPHWKPRPSLLLHELGSWADNNALDDVFTVGEHTIVVNAAGCGKTRLLLEGFCQHWGLYISCAVDVSGDGSRDVHDLLSDEFDSYGSQFQAYGPWTERDVYCNTRMAARYFSVVLLSRLLLLQAFLQSLAPADRDTPQARKRWALMQFRAPFLGLGDILCNLSGHLKRLLPDVAKKAIKDALLGVRALLGRRECPIFCALDEAQRADGMPFTGEGTTLLRAMARVWEEHEGVTVVLAGTGVDPAPFGPSYRLRRGLGVFGTREEQRAYVLKYMPPAVAGSAAGRLLVRRMWTWLRGRYRFTTAFVGCLLRTGFRQPHMLLSAYVYEMLRVVANDVPASIIASEGQVDRETWRMVEGLCGFRGRFLHTSNPAWFSAHAAIHRVLLGETCVTFRSHCAPIVARAAALFTDDTMSVARLYEPTIIFPLAPAIFADYTVVKGFYPAEDAKRLREPPHHPFQHLAFANLLVRALQDRRRLCDLFTFSGKPPAWASETVQLVRLASGTAGKARATAFRTSSSGSWVTDSPVWLDPSVSGSAPFCAAGEFSNADLLFILRTASGHCLYVALAVMFGNAHVEISADDVRERVAGLAPGTVFHKGGVNPELRLPRFAKEVEGVPVLRVVSGFPHDVDVDRVGLFDDMPVAVVNTTLFCQVAGEISYQDVCRRLVSVLTGKRKRTDMDHEEGPRKRAMTTRSMIQRELEDRRRS